MHILGIETSCDETAAAVVERNAQGQGHIISNIVWSQIAEHAAYGGVVPELAARAHVEKLDIIIAQALSQAKMRLEQIDAIAVSAGPGLVGGLMVGLVSAKALCLALNKPLLAINHLEGHALTARLTNAVDFPFLLLLVSGGHTQLLLIKDFQNYERLGSTIDDALGEAFDKTAKLLGLGYPGGPAVESYASKGDATAYAFPRPLKDRAGFNFSFSGLKTAIRNCVEQERAKNGPQLEPQLIANICASFQSAVCDVLNNRVEQAMLYFKKLYGLHANPQSGLQSGLQKAVFVVAGGVAANKYICEHLKALSKYHDFCFIAPPQNLCGDNAAMIAWAGAEHFAAGNYSNLDFAARARWPLDEKTVTLLGSGKKGAKA